MRDVASPHQRTAGRLGVVLSVILVVLLCLPAIQSLWPMLPNGAPLVGYVEDPVVPPYGRAHGWFNRTLQGWIEGSIRADLGFRPLLVRTFNEVDFDLFNNLPRANELATDRHDIYHYLSLKGLNELVIRKATFEDKYRVLAVKLRALQDALSARGKHFEVVIATSKAFVSLDGVPDRYLVAPREGIFGKTADVASILKQSGVNVFDGTAMLRALHAGGVSTHATSGAHWNYYASCLVTRQLLDDSRHDLGDRVPQLGCDPPQLGPPRYADLDGVELLNRLTDGGLVTPTPFPTVTATSSPLRFLFVGDSFSWHIIDSLTWGRAASTFTFWLYYRERLTLSPVDASVVTRQQATEGPTGDVRADLAAADVIVLEMVDFNLNHWGYGFVEQALEQLADQRVAE